MEMAAIHVEFSEGRQFYVFFMWSLHIYMYDAREVPNGHLPEFLFGSINFVLDSLIDMNLMILPLILLRRTLLWQ